MIFTNAEQLLNADLSLNDEVVCQLVYNLTGRNGKGLNARQVGKAIELLHQKLVDANLVLLAANQLLAIQYDPKTNNFIYTKRDPAEAARLAQSVASVFASGQSAPAEQ